MVRQIKERAMKRMLNDSASHDLHRKLSFDSSAVSRKYVTNLVDRTLGNSVQPGQTSNHLCEWFDLDGRADNMRKDWRSYRYHSVIKEYEDGPSRHVYHGPEELDQKR